MKTTKVCHMREAFLTEWRLKFPAVPLPVLEGIGDIREGGSVDELEAPGHNVISAVRDSLVSVDDEIKQLEEQIRGKLFVKQFLLSVLEVLDEKENVEERLSEVRKQLSDVNNRGVNNRSRVPTAHAERTFAGPLPVAAKEGQKQRADAPVSPFRISDNGLKDSVCCVYTSKGKGLESDSPSSKFVSRINVGGSENNARSPRSVSPVSPSELNSSSRSNTLGCDDKRDEKESNTSIRDKSLSTSSDDAEMFRRNKGGGAKPHDEERGPHCLGSKDNFLAVKSKHIASSEVPRHPDGALNSPQLTRHFQLLKLTSGFDIVLDNSSGDDDNTPSNAESRSPNRSDNIDSGRASRGSDYEGNNPILGGDAINRHGFDTDDDVTPLSDPRENVSTFQIRKVGIKGDESHQVKDANKPDVCKTYSDHSVDSKRSPGSESSGFHLREQLSPSQPPVVGSRPKSCEGVLESNIYSANQRNPNFVQRDARVPSRKAPVPPPVAKKPIRPGSGKKLPSIPSAVETHSAESRPGNSGDPSAGKDNVVAPPASSSLAGDTVEVAADIELDKRSGGALPLRHSGEGSETAGVLQSGYQNENRFGELRSNNSKPQPSVPSESELKPECDSQLIRPHSDCSEEIGVAKQEVDTQGTTQSERKLSSADIVNTEQSSTEREDLSPAAHNNEDQNNEMSNYKFPPGFDGRRKRNSLGELVDGKGGLSGLLIRKRAEETNIDGDDDDSMPPPEVPPKHIESETMKDEATLDRMISSASSDTIVNEFDRTQSFSSDLDVKDAVYSLDDVIHGLDKSDQAERPSVATPSKKRLSSTPSYENWTINRAITRSITRDFDSVSDDDELDDNSLSSATTSPCLKRQEPSKGSKDSGLCDDISAPDTSNMDTSSDLDLASGRVRDLKTIQQMESCAEEDDHHVFNEEADQDKDMDAVSVASDIVFIRGSEGGSGPRDGEDSSHRFSIDRESLDTGSMASSGEEETSTTMDSSYDETDSARDGMLKMRQLVVKGVLDSEKVYLGILETLIHYKRSLEASSQSSQPVIAKADIDAIFCNIETIFEIQREFVSSLEPKVKNWTHGEQIGETFKVMILQFEKFSNYLNNYQQAVSTIHRCCQESEQFQQLAQQIKVSSATKEVTSLEDALFKPVQRVQRNTLVLHDLIKYTPGDHPDHGALQKALKISQHILERFATTIPQRTTTQENRRLVKSSFLVELVNGQRKLRYMFLFSDVLVCTKRETHRNNKVSFDIKWFTPLCQTSIDTKFNYTDDNKFTKKDDINSLKNKIRALKKEMRQEMRKYDDKDKHRSVVSLGGATRVVEKLQKKINTYEAQLILASPKLPFKVSLDKGQVYTLLMSTDYEREEWKETIASLCSRFQDNNPQAMSSIFVQDLINSVKETPQVNKIGSVLLQKDEEPLTGILNVTIHTVNGLTEACDTYCCLEMDSFGHFFMKAKTHICEASRDPAWNEDFELELEGSQTLRILCFKKEPGNQGDTLLGRGALELSKHWLKGSFQEKTLSMNEISLVISVRHTPADKTMQRTPSRSGSAVFGVKITSCARREGKTVPTIVTACIQEVEKRGLDEVGIYRVSGVTSDLQMIKKLFDKNVKAGAQSIQDVDIHAVTGVLKLYFRELPEPLFTEASYQSFIDTLKLSDEESRAQCMLSLLHDLPDTNYYTIVALLEHLIKVAKNVGENKMSIHNLSTVFGPTLLAPASKQASTDPLELMCKGAEQVMRQSGVINYLLGLAVSGRSLRRSAQSGENISSVERM